MAASAGRLPAVLDYPVFSVPERPTVTLVTCDSLGTPLIRGGHVVTALLQRCDRAPGAVPRGRHAMPRWGGWVGGGGGAWGAGVRFSGGLWLVFVLMCATGSCSCPVRYHALPPSRSNSVISDEPDAVVALLDQPIKKTQARAIQAPVVTGATPALSQQRSAVPREVVPGSTGAHTDLCAQAVVIAAGGVGWNAAPRNLPLHPP